jgi:predicted permease
MSQGVINQMIVLFGLMAVGYICNRTGVLDEVANAKLSSFLLKAALPATILNSAIAQSDLQRSVVLSTMAVAVGVFLVTPALSVGVTKLLRLPPTYQLMLNYSNLAFMGFPIIGGVFGAEYIFYGAVFLMVFNLHIFSFGVMALQGGGGDLKTLGKKLLNPGIISAVIAFFIVMFHIHVPEQLTLVISGLGGVTTPMAMIVIGSQLGPVNFLEVLRKRDLYLMAVLKLAIFPAVIFGLLSLILGPGHILTKIATILVGLPVAGNVTMLCSEYGGDTALSAQGTCVTTLLSLLTIPLMLSFLG